MQKLLKRFILLTFSMVMSIGCTIPGGNSVSAVNTYYITDSELPMDGNITWNKTEANRKITAVFPDKATYCYASITDANGNDYKYKISNHKII